MWLVLLHLGGVVVVVVEEEPQSTTRLQPFLPRQLGSSQTSGGCLLMAPGQLGAGGGAGAAPPPPPPAWLTAAPPPLLPTGWHRREPLWCSSQPCHGPYPHPAQGGASALACLVGMLGCREPAVPSHQCISHRWGDWGGGTRCLGPPGWLMVVAAPGPSSSVAPWCWGRSDGGDGSPPLPWGCGAPETWGD